MISPQEKEKEKKEPTISDKREILPKKKKKRFQFQSKST